MKKIRRQRGLSLVEMSAAMALVAIALVSTAAAVLSGSALADETIQLSAAGRASSALMEEIRAADFDQITSYHGKRLDLARFDAALTSGFVDVEVTEVDNGTAETVYRVSLAVTYDAASDSDTLHVLTYVSDRTAGGALAGSIPLLGGPDEAADDEGLDETDDAIESPDDPESVVDDTHVAPGQLKKDDKK